MPHGSWQDFAIISRNDHRRIEVSGREQGQRAVDTNPSLIRHHSPQTGRDGHHDELEPFPPFQTYLGCTLALLPVILDSFRENVSTLCSDEATKFPRSNGGRVCLASWFSGPAALSPSTQSDPPPPPLTSPPQSLAQHTTAHLQDPVGPLWPVLHEDAERCTSIGSRYAGSVSQQQLQAPKLPRTWHAGGCRGKRDGGKRAAEERGRGRVSVSRLRYAP